MTMNLERQITPVQLTDRMGKIYKFDNLKKLISFINREVNYWNKARAKTSQNIDFGISCFQRILRDIGDVEIVNNWDDFTLNNKTNHVIQNNNYNIMQDWLSSEHEFSDRVVEIINEHDYATAIAFLSYLKDVMPDMHSKASFNGSILAYEYHFQNSDLVKRRGAERSTITRLREKLLEENEQLIDQIEQNRNEYNEWFKSSKSKIKSFTDESNGMILRRHRAIKKLAKKEHEFFNKSFDSQLSVWMQRIHELENTYQDKLRLKKPAEYWQRSAKKYKNQGVFLIFCIGALVSLSMIVGLELFQSWLLGGETVLSVKSLPGFVLFTSMVAILAFTLRALSRLAFSTFHLMRDSEEREQLTYLYLSLSNESVIDKDSRDIILQALFCRSETGLLLQDSAPTMPGFADAIKELTKNK